MINTEADLVFRSTCTQTKIEITGPGPKVRKAIRTLRKVFGNEGYFTYQRIGNGIVFATWGYLIFEG